MMGPHELESLKYYNDVLELLSDRWITGGNLYALIHEDHPEAKVSAMRVGISHVLHRMKEKGMVECKCDPNWRVGYKWRLKMT